MVAEGAVEWLWFTVCFEAVEGGGGAEEEAKDARFAGMCDASLNGRA